MAKMVAMPSRKKCIGRATVILMALLLVGCASPADSPTEAEAPGAASDDPLAPRKPGQATSSNPTNPAGSANAADSAAETHVHDYWQGSETLGIIDEAWEGYNTCIGGEGCFLRHLQPPDGTIVPPGTARLHAIVTWSDEWAGGAVETELWVTTADNDERHFVAALVKDQVVSFDVEEPENDLAHQGVSRWNFFIYARHPSVVPVLFHTGMHLKVDAERSEVLPSAGPHPDFWEGSSKLTLIKGISARSQLFVGTPSPSGTFAVHVGDPLSSFTLDKNATVPLDADHVDVLVRYTQRSDGGLQLHYHGADTRTWTPAPVDSDDGSLRVYRIPVGLAGDSPYAKRSVWEFYFDWADDPTGTGMGAYSGTMEISAAAFRYPV